LLVRPHQITIRCVGFFLRSLYFLRLHSQQNTTLLVVQMCIAAVAVTQTT